MKKRWVKITLWTLGSIVALVAIILGVALWILTPERLTPLVNRYASQYLDAKVEFSRIEVSLFSHFPRVELSLVDGNIISEAIDDRRDTLLNFARLDLRCDAMAILRSNRIEVSGVRLDATKINAVIDPRGHASWDIVKPSTDTLQTDTTTSAPFVFNISDVRITGGLSVCIDDLRDGSRISAKLRELSFDGIGSTQTKEIRLSKLSLYDLLLDIKSDNGKNVICSKVEKLHASKIGKGYSLGINSRSSVIQNGDSLVRHMPIDMIATVNFDLEKSNSFEIHNAEIRLSDITLGADGRLDIVSDSTLVSDLRLSVRQFAVSHALSLIPTSISPWLPNVSTSVELGMETKVQGTYNFVSGKLPDISVRLDVKDGFLRYNGLKARLDNLSMTANAQYNSDTTNRSFAEISNLNIGGSGIRLNGKVRVEDFLGDPLIKGQIDGDVNLGVLSIMFPSKSGTAATGELKFNVACNSRVSSMNLSSLARVGINGRAELKSVSWLMPKDSIYAHANGSMSFSSAQNRQDTTLAIGSRVLVSTIDLDTVSFQWGKELIINSGRLNVVGTTSAMLFAANKEKAVRPLHFSITGDRMRVMTSDSAMLALRGVAIKLNLDPSTDDNTTPHLNTLIDARSVVARTKEGRFILSSPRFAMSSTIISRERDSIARRETMLDRLAKRYPHVKREKLLQYNKMMQIVGMAKKDELASGDIDMTLDKDLLSLLRRWRSNGTLSARRLRAITPYIPLQTAMTDFDFRFDNDNIDLKNAKLKVGRSDISLSGKLSNISRALSGRGNLVARMNVAGDTLDVNQLIAALNTGMKVASTVSSAIDQTDSEDKVEEIIAKEAENHALDQLIIVPKNIDLDILLSVEKAYYSDIELDSLRGELISRNRILQINNLHANSSIGRMKLNAVYATRSKDDITTGFDVTLSGVNVKELIDLIPEVDSMLPMLRSFEGHLDCKLAATASLDSTMGLLIPTLNAAGSISGRNMVLLDGETFTEISKILRFKNRARNVVAKISVEMLIRNSAVEIFPFVVEIDRYKAAVSGVQKLDMSFDYHIAVLKSIIPFRVGVDIFGKDLDNWDFRITKARYKNENVPSYSSLIDTTRIDLRRAITDIFKTGLDNLVLKETAITPHVDSSVIAATDSTQRADSMSRIQTDEGSIDRSKRSSNNIKEPKKQRKDKKQKTHQINTIKPNDDEDQ